MSVTTKYKFICPSARTKGETYRDKKVRVWKSYKMTEA